MGCVTSLIGLWQSRGFILILGDRESCTWGSGCIKPQGPGPQLTEISGKISSIFSGLWFKPYLSYYSRIIYETVSVGSLEEAGLMLCLPSHRVHTVYILRPSQKWVALNWQEKSYMYLKHRELTSFNMRRNKCHLLLCASSWAAKDIILTKLSDFAILML